MCGRLFTTKTRYPDGHGYFETVTGRCECRPMSAEQRATHNKKMRDLRWENIAKQVRNSPEFLAARHVREMAKRERAMRVHPSNYRRLAVVR